MTSRIVKLGIVALLGSVLAWQGIFAVFAGASVRSGDAGCCRSACASSHCSRPTCCAKPPDNRVPPGPAAVPSQTANEWQALPASVSTFLILSSVPAGESSAPARSDLRVAAIPIFQRDCSYLL
jgi:hypothetical protein